MKTSILDVNFVDEENEKINCYQECIGNLNDPKKTVINTKNKDEIKVVGEETEEGLKITFIDNSTMCLQNGSNNLHK